MTERNFTTVVPGFYRTRGGEIAEVVQIMNARLEERFPARGLGAERWQLSGDYYDYGRKSCYDLIEFLGTEKPKEKKMVKKTLTRWANIYEGRDVATFATKEHADLRAGFCRLACVELTGEYEVEVFE